MLRDITFVQIFDYHTVTVLNSVSKLDVSYSIIPF